MYTIPDWAHTAPDFTDKKAFSAYQKALTDDVTPLSLDTENGAAEFEGKHGHYAASLEGCPCGARPKPCKHMYRIAMELGLMPGHFSSDKNKIVARQIVHQVGVTSADVKAALSSLDDDTKRLICNIAANSCGYKLGEDSVLIVRTPGVDRLVELGLIDETIGDYLHCDRMVSKSGIRSALLSSGLDAPDDLFTPRSRWSSIFSHLQFLYSSFPEKMLSTFAVVNGTAITHDKAHVITRFLSSI